ncbi:O-methylsterigmatocystin oxidoreductase [Trametes elegans]|nr:O-methylsterigmatocystin oxidoreductase [Trametes elegans]
MATTSVVWVGALTAVVLLVIRRLISRSSSAKLGLPPGPQPLPIIGNLFDLPTKNLAASFHALTTKYGDYTYLNVLGQPMVILGSYEAAYSLLENRSATTSGRPPCVMAELTGYMPWEFGLWGYTDEWRRHRKAFHQLFHQNVIPNYQPIQVAQTRQFLRKLAADPDDFVAHIRHLFGSTILRLVYGLEVADHNDRYIGIAERAADIYIKITVPGRYLVETLPFLRYVPSWFPGAGFKRKAAAWKQDVLALRNAPFDNVKQKIGEGTALPSIAASLLEGATGKNTNSNISEEDLYRNVTAIAYLTGADTTFSSVQAFFLAMAMHPAAQRRAQAELDAVVGAHRLPAPADRDALPYVGALVKEVFRTHVVAPLGIPHETTAAEELRGWRLPAGTVLVANQWAIARDARAYPDPGAFMPERFLKDGKLDPAVRDPQKFAFGFGRRVCPGRHFADASLFLIAASVLHVFDIQPPLDAHGAPVALEARATADLLLSYPEPFSCRVTPRAGRADALLAAERPTPDARRAR